MTAVNVKDRLTARNKKSVFPDPCQERVQPGTAYLYKHERAVL
jgi:hypothetical protein